MVHNMVCLQVQILDLLPRPNPQNESFGVTTAYSIGWWNRTGYSTPGYAPDRSASVVYKVWLSASQDQGLVSYTVQVVFYRVQACLTQMRLLKCLRDRCVIQGQCFQC